MDNLVTEPSPFLCQPGVVNKSPGKGASITYTFNPAYRMLPPDAADKSKVHRNERLGASLKIPIINRPKFKALVGLGYSMERYHIQEQETERYPLFKRMNDADLKNAGIAAYFFRPLNHKYYVSMRVSANWQGDYGKFVSFQNKYAVYQTAGIFGVKKREDLEFGAGLLFRHGYNGASFAPFGFYNQTFNRHWGIESVLPSSVRIRYNFKEGSMALVGADLSGQNYVLNVNENITLPVNTGEKRLSLHHFNRSSLELTASYYQHLSGWLWVQLKTGYAFNINTKAKDLPASTTFDLRPSNSLVGTISFFLSPPKSCLKSKPISAPKLNRR